MVRTLRLATVLGVVGVLIGQSSPADAERRGRRRAPRSEVVAWTADGTLVVFAEPRGRSRRLVDLVARRVPTGEVVGRTQAHPGPCARMIGGQVAVSHACALARLRPDLPRTFREGQFHVAASERYRIQRLSLRAGAVVEREIPTLGIVLRGRTEEEGDDGQVAVLEVNRLGRTGGRVIDRRPIRPRARRHWVLLQAGEDHVIVVGAGVLQRLRRARPRPEAPLPPSSDLASSRSRRG
jgi:hypothetical protein